MRIAICDDEKNQLEEISLMVKGNSCVRTVQTYDAALHLIDDYASGVRYDLIFMDIQMDGVDGFDAAKILRNAYTDENPRIAFLTKTEEYVKSGYSIGIWDYISKPVSVALLSSVIDRVRAELEKREVFIPIIGGTHKFKFKEIIYIESSYGKLDIHSVCGNYEVRLTLEEISQILPKPMFCQVHRCYLINLGKIVQHSKTGIHMANDTYIPVGRKWTSLFLDSMAGFLRVNSDAW